MKQISWLLGILLFLSPLQMSAQKQDTVAVRETRIPVLIERQDNELFNLRIDATQSQVLNDVKLSFGKEVNLNEIEAVKLYYGGTESSERKGKTYFAPVDYIPSNTPGKTLAANPSYSILKAEVKAPKRDVVLKVDQKLYPGVNYFWVSLQMKPTASVLAKVSVEMTGVTMDNRTAPVKVVRKADTHYMGVGVRHAGARRIIRCRNTDVPAKANGSHAPSRRSRAVRGHVHPERIADRRPEQWTTAAVFQFDRNFKTILLGQRLLASIAASRAEGCTRDSRQRLPASTTNHIAEHAADDASSHCPKDGGTIFLKRNGLHGNHRAILYRLSAAHLTAGIGIAAVVGATSRKHGESEHAYGYMFDFQHSKPPIESQG